MSFLDYNGLSRFLSKVKDLIPTKTSDITNDSGFLTGSDIDSALSTTSENAVQNKVVNTALGTKANDNGVVHNTTDETISGVKSFNSDPNINLTDSDIEDIVDSDHESVIIHNTGNETINGVKTFPDGIVSNVTGSATSVPWSGITGKPSTFTPSSHTHASTDITGLSAVATSGSYDDLSNKPTIDSALSATSENSVQNKVVKNALDSKSDTGHTHTSNDVTGLSTVATSGSYNDLSNKPTIPTVNNATLTIQKNGTNVKTFTANSSTNVTANITVPTKTSDLTNDSGFLTSHNPIDTSLSSTSTNSVQNKVVKNALDSKSDTGHTHTASEVSGLSTVATSGSYNDLSNKPTIPTVNNATLTIQKNGSTVKTFTANASSNVTANIVVPTKTSDLTNDSGFLTSHNPIDSALSSTSSNAVQNKVINSALSSKSDTGHTHTKSEITDFPTLATVATSGSYNDLSNKPTIPSVYNKTLTIQKNGTNVATFTSNSNSNVTANITVPTSVSELTNDSGYLTSASSLDSSKLTGTIDIARLPAGALERLVTVANQTARFALTTSDVQLGDTVKQLDTGLMYIVSDTGKLNSASGYTEYTAGSATSVPWSGVTNKPSSYTPASHTHGNIANGGTLGTASKALITDANKKITTSSVSSTELGYLSGVTSSVQTQLDGKASSTHTHSSSDVTGLATVATSGSYNDLTNKPTIPTVNNATLTIQKNGTNVKTFTANASSNVTANITVPTKVSELTNDSGFLTSHQSLDDYSTKANTISGLSVSGKVITYTKGDGTTGTITTQDTNTDTLMTQNVSTTNATYPILLCPTADATANQGAKTGIFAKSVKINPKTNVVSASGFSGPLTGNVTGNCSGSSGSCTGNAATASKVVATVANDTTGALVQGTMGSNDVFRIAVGGASNAGWAEIATGDDYNEPIYVRQYKGSFATLQRTATLLDASGNTSFPGTVTATGFSGSLTGNVTGNCSGSSGSCTGNAATATKATKDSAGQQINTTYIKGLSVSGKTITYTKGDGTTGTITTQDTNTTYSNFVKSGSGAKAGLVPAPSTTAGTTKYLREDGTWQVPPDHTYTVNNAKLTIQKNGTTVKTFTANASSNVTANIIVPTKVSELTNDKGYLTSHQSLSNYLTKTTNVSEMGRYIDLHFDNATSKYDYDARIYVDSQGTAKGGGALKISASSAYAPAPASDADDSRIATTKWVRDISPLQIYKDNTEYSVEIMAISDEWTSSSSSSSVIYKRGFTVSVIKGKPVYIIANLTTEENDLLKIYVSNVFCIGLKTLEGNNAYSQTVVGYGPLINQTSTGHTRVFSMVWPYSTSIVLNFEHKTNAHPLTGGSNPAITGTLTVYQ